MPCNFWYIFNVDNIIQLLLFQGYWIMTILSLMIYLIILTIWKYDHYIKKQKWNDKCLWYILHYMVIGPSCKHKSSMTQACVFLLTFNTRRGHCSQCVKTCSKFIDHQGGDGEIQHNWMWFLAETYVNVQRQWSSGHGTGFRIQGCEIDTLFWQKF